ncbi:MAG: Ig-like domain-containing protein [Bacteroidetes bacterium]|nr:Ig-like domain-containing protein [Bacteroidota bacterium]MBU1116813.1 Ig-like domain-containing protein [Bacteroidota bacterium]MBU1799424.1 Ig-like domain-containing protein [Bacteroidota bacterium]
MKKTLLFILVFSIQVFSQDFSIISHRGGAALAPENTLGAFQNSVAIGAHYYELDVRLSSDDSLVIMHDDTINRTTNGTGSINSMTYAQLSLWDAGSWFSPLFAGEKIPLLSEALDIAINAPYEIGVVIEIKSTEATIVAKVIDLVRKKKMENRVIISSFNFTQVVQSISIAPEIDVQLFAGSITETMINNMGAMNAEWVGSGGDLTPALINLAHAKNVKVNRWTLNGAAEIQALIANNYDAVTTDNPIVAFSVLDLTAPSSVVLNEPEVIDTKVKLSWSEATDDESGISHYEIYRSNLSDASELLTTVKGETTYIDETLKEEETFYYRVKAVNYAGISSESFSNEVIAVTGTDLKAPKVKVISAYGLATKIIIAFNERLDKTSAEDVANYGINGITINQAVLSVDSSSVILTTSDLTHATEYTLSLVNIKDLSANQNMIIDTLFFQFTYNSYLGNVVGAWEFDEVSGTTITDNSGSSNNGTTFGEIGLTSGYTGNGLKFDGVDDYVEIPASTSLNINGDKVSVSLWTKLAYLPSDLPTGYGPLFDSDTDNYVIYEDRGNNELRFKVATSAGAERPGIPSSQLSADKWINIVGVYDGATASIYLDGVLIDTHNLTGTVNTGQVAIIGKSSGSFFEGSIDNIQVFAKALSLEEIEYLHTGFISSYIDDISPEVLGVNSLGANNNVFINFNEEIEKLSAEVKSNYNIDNGTTIQSAQLSVDGKTVILTTSPLAENTIYTVTINEIKDLADIPNQILENTQIELTHKSFPSGLISYWSFDEGIDTLANDWNNLNNGFVKNGTEWTNGKSGNSLRFDAIDDYVKIPNSASLDIDTNAVTVSFWVMLDFLPADQPYGIGPLYDSGTDNYVIYVDKGNKELRFKVTTTVKAERPGIPADALTTGEWLNVTGVYNGSEAKIFLNGMLMDSHSITGNIKPGQVASIGKDGTNYFSGQIDNVQIYNRGLTDQEVAFLYSGIKTPTVAVSSVDETTVNLSWNDVHDPLFGLSGFNLYRDTTASPTTLLSFVKDTTGYSDQTREELTTFYYRVQAIDGNGNASPYFSNDIMVTTETDVTSPELLSMRTTGEPNKVFINFNEVVESESALLLNNYSINNSITINEIKLSADNKNVILTVSDLTPSESYTLAISNIKDMSIAGNVIEANSQKSFIFNSYFESLVSFWPLDEVEDTTTFDVFGTNNGKVKNPTFTDGKFGNALFFNGVSDFVEVPQSTSLDMASEGVTISLWVNLSYLPTEMPTGVGPIYDAPQDRYVMYEDKGNKELRFKVTTANGAERPGIPEAALTKGEWLNITGVYDGTQALIYLNGELKDVHTGITGLVKDGQVARIGQDGSNYFNGAIDNVQIYNRGLTPEEVKSLYNGDIVTASEKQETIPASYSLSQNYPNPFNPSTTIKYSIPAETFHGMSMQNVQLKIYDILGREVTTLISKQQKAGNYEVKFDASNLTSGIYFYRLQSGSFNESKKMILIK